MDQWVIAAIAAVGVCGQWIVGSRASAKREGVIDERMKSHGARILLLEQNDKDHETRISTVEGRLNGAHPRR